MYFDESGRAVLQLVDTNQAGAARAAIRPLIHDRLIASGRRGADAPIVVRQVRYDFLQLARSRERLRTALGIDGVVYLDIRVRITSNGETSAASEFVVNDANSDCEFLC